MNRIKEVVAGSSAAFIGTNGLFNIDALNQYLAALVSIVLIAYYVKKIFFTKTKKKWKS